MKIVVGKIDNPLSAFVFDPRSARIPLIRNRPVERPGPTRYFVNHELGHEFFQIGQCFPNSVAREASADREKVCGPSVHLPTSSILGWSAADHEIHPDC